VPGALPEFAVSIVSAGSGQAQSEVLGGRLKAAGIAIACLLGFLLLYAGQRGKHQVNLQLALNGVISARDRLQQKLEGEKPGAPALLSASTTTDPNLGRLAGTLKTQLDQFVSQYGEGRLADDQNLEIRLSRATLANAEGRFTEALSTLTERDEKSRPGPQRVQQLRQAQALLIRGDSFFGLHNWGEALNRFQQVLVLQPKRTLAMARLADCQIALGKRNEGLSTLQELANVQSSRGDTLLALGKLDAAISHYENAIEVQRNLNEHGGGGELFHGISLTQNKLGNALLLQDKPGPALVHYEKAIEIQTRQAEAEQSQGSAILALSYYDRGNALLAQENPSAAMTNYDRAIKIRSALYEQNGGTDLSSDLGLNHGNFGDALLALGKPGEAIEHYNKAIQLLTPLVTQSGQSALANELALIYNNRGVIRCVQKQLDDAIIDFDSAVTNLSGLIDEMRQTSHNNWRTGFVGQTQVKLDVLFGFSDKSIEVVTRPRLLEKRGQTESAVTFATSLSNRGYARLVRGNLGLALEDFERAAGTYATIVDQEGQRDLALRFAKSLTPLAWIYATTADNSVRNGSKAMEYAFKACELSAWNAYMPVESLAAACAESGDFASAVKWQEKALELAPGPRKPEVRSRLELYKSGSPYREALAKAK
jgi:tetratricopeptide (TPR) repeat protein